MSDICTICDRLWRDGHIWHDRRPDPVCCLPLSTSCVLLLRLRHTSPVACPFLTKGPNIWQRSLLCQSHTPTERERALRWTLWAIRQWACCAMATLADCVPWFPRFSGDKHRPCHAWWARWRARTSGRNSRTHGWSDTVHNQANWQYPWCLWRTFPLLFRDLCRQNANSSGHCASLRNQSWNWLPLRGQCAVCHWVRAGNVWTLCRSYQPNAVSSVPSSCRWSRIPQSCSSRLLEAYTTSVWVEVCFGGELSPQMSASYLACGSWVLHQTYPWTTGSWIPLCWHWVHLSIWSL